MVNAQCVLEFCIPYRRSVVFTYTCMSVLTSLAITSLSLVIVVYIKPFPLFYIVFSKIIFGEMGTPRIGSCIRLCFYYILLWCVAVCFYISSARLWYFLVIHSRALWKCLAVHCFMGVVCVWLPTINVAHALTSCIVWGDTPEMIRWCLSQIGTG